MTDRDLLELIATQVGKLTADVDEIKAILPTLATREELTAWQRSRIGLCWLWKRN